MTLLRAAEHTALSRVALSGKVLDLGGDTRSSYRNLFQGSYTLTTVNNDPKTQPDIAADIEHPLPIADASYDAVLLINLLEHIYDYRAVIAESRRVLVSGGKIVIVVPYLFPYHASPDDYHRYSASALRRMLGEFSDVQITSLGSGVFAARWLLLERLLPAKLQAVLQYLAHPLTSVVDALFTGLARGLQKQYDPSHYALGFLVTAAKK